MLSYRNKLYQNYNTNQVNQSGRHSFSQKFIEESEWFSKEILPLIQDKKELQILDIGCGNGSLLHACKLAGYTKIIGIDISAEQVMLAHQLGITEVKHAETIEYLNSTPDQYDVIFCMDIIEHFTKDELVVLLDLVKSRMNDQARIIIRTPNMDTPFNSIYAFGDFTHENHLNAQSANQLMLSLGFKEIQTLPSRMATKGFIKEIVRSLLWTFINIFIRLIIFSTGRSSKNVILSPNLIIIAKR